MPRSARSGARTSWLVGLVLGALGAFALLEFPLAGAALTAVTLVLVARAGRAVAGVGGLLVGLGGMWLALFGRVALTCTEASSCFAPGIGSAVTISAAVLAVGAALSIVTAVRAREG